VVRRRGSAFAVTTAALILLAALALVPTPFYLISPGTAVDLSKRIAVEGRVPLRRHFYLTDVTVTHATALLLAAGLWPGTRVVHRRVLVPDGVTAHDYDRIMTIAMDDSQQIAAYVAERAAGLRVSAPSRTVIVASLAPNSRAAGLLHVGDRLIRIGGHAVYAPSDVSSAVRILAPGVSANLEIEHDGRVARLRVPTILADGHTRLGVFLNQRGTTPPLPVPVHFSLDDVEGSSGGLMFALAIYAELTGDRSGPSAIAGTGTLDADGNVGPIEGAPQKLIAAKRAGANVFLVPRPNYPDVANERDIVVIPVDTFSQALAALR
jgi:PDZ domain-containing protein